VKERVVFNLDGALPSGFEQALSSLARVEVQGEWVVIHASDQLTVPLVSEVVNLLTAQGIRYRDLRSEQPTLEDVYLNLTSHGKKG
jgi:hypothetical protein